MREISDTGSIVPTSLLAVMTETRAVSGVKAFRTSSGSIPPNRSTGTGVVAKPSFSRLLAD